MSIDWAGGRFHGWALMSFHQPRWTVPGARMCWLTWGRGVFPSRGQVSGLSWQPVTAPWTMGCSSCLIIQSSWASQSIESCCTSLALHPGAWKPSVWAHVGSRWSGLPELYSRSLSWHSCCNQPPWMQQDCLYHSPGSILPVRCSFGVSTVMFPMYCQSAGNTTEFWAL